MSKKLESKVALITGAGSGMGRAMCLEFAREGARIIAVDLNLDSAKRVESELGGGDACLALAGDVSNSKSVADFCGQALDATGRVDILVNNAGILDNYASVTDTSEELWDRIIGVNLKGMFLVCRALLPAMVERRSGVIINLGSIAGFVAGGGGAAYTSSKHGVIGFTRQLAFDYGKLGVRANAICPGAVETGMTKDILASGDMAVIESIRSVPAGRHAQPEEIAKLGLYLASDDSSFVHGAAMLIDGGWTIK
ncbi:3-oxoacyl-[acyl-carrier protein] reductase [Roseiarcus fermentans]|uniref:3-oxoacyl-[acyl-carrier protein] reductase n=1 Tax=Roseiarcus fermentans TaxID=1473586 RepID=A0A366F0R1_9HYPH|nr:glucose 1-dehydrogenase [Roseiarcus fermentans]RBP07309.1 3-oxoacyl-[acyl-carrier protein] reductase [Roseiarcus fermentans]